MGDSEKRLFLALGISMAIFLLWSVLFPVSPPPKKVDVQRELPVVVPTSISEPTQTASPTPSSTPKSSVSSDETILPEELSSETSEEEETEQTGPPVVLRNDQMVVKCRSTDGQLESLKLLGYEEAVVNPRDIRRALAKARGPDKRKLEELLDLLVSQEKEKALFLERMEEATEEERERLERELELLGAKELMPTQLDAELGYPLGIREINGPYLRKGTVRDADSRSLEIVYPLDDGLVLEERLELGKDHLAELYLSWKNPTEEVQSWALSSGFQVEWGGNVGLDSGLDRYGSRYSGPAYRVEYEVEKKPSMKAVKEIRKNESLPIRVVGDVQWLALRSKYFMVAFMPVDAANGISYRANEKGQLGVALHMDGVTVQPGEEVKRRIQLYLGPKDYYIVQDQALHDPSILLQKAVDLSYWSIFDELSLVILRALEWFKGWTGDYGIAIICLTVLLKVLMFPLSHKGYLSMRKTQELQPVMQQLRQQYKNNPKLLQQEMSKLYKKHGVNPLSGCLPMFLQMPVFMTLFGTLSSSIRLRGQPFKGTWIHDLSRPDTVGYLPSEIPVIGGSQINILPLFMVIGMVVQQKISTPTAATTEQAQQQKMMMFMMPVFFFFICYSMPSGLTLYWFLQTLISLFEHTVVRKRHRSSSITEAAKNGEGKDSKKAKKKKGSNS